MPRKAIFDLMRDARGKGFTPDLVAAVDKLLDLLGIPREGDTKRTVSAKGIALLHKWEGCKLAAYPDPGSDDGEPWTIGWGSTGEGIRKGVRWTQEQADARFEADLQRYADEVSDYLGDAPTTQDQFDALVSFHYNTGAIRKSTLGRLHKAGDYAGAAKEFGRWVKNAGRVMQGLVNRRADERKLYTGQA